MLSKYRSEIEGMIDFWNELGIEPDYSLNTDGRYKGNLIEFKLVFLNLKEHKSQIRRYIVAYNSASLPIPKYSYLISINERKYIKIDNETGKEVDNGRFRDPDDFIPEFDSQNDFIKGWIDEYSIVSYNNKLCNDNPKIFKSKEDVKKEFINPKYLYIKPFDWNKQIKAEEKDKKNIGWLHFSINRLGPSLLKKQLGAFFTPDIYVKKSTEMVRDAIVRIPKGNDYIIFDRCAGTGNLERFLTNEELSHCVLNTCDYTEWTTLKGLYNGRVKMIIPPTKSSMDLNSGVLVCGDALSEEFYDFCFNSSKLVKSKHEKEYLNQSKLLSNWLLDKNINIIMLENPPFVEPQSGANKGKKTFIISDKYIYQEMGKEKFDTKNVNRASENQFIWSAFKYFLKKPNDAYILYSPIKYWKSQHIIDKKLVSGYLCNRKYFVASEGGTLLAEWLNVDEKNKTLKVDSDLGPRVIKKIKSNPAILLKDSAKKQSIAMLFNLSNIPKKNDNGKLVNIVSDSYRAVQKPYNLTEENILSQLPLWAANCYEGEDYTEIEVIMKTGDQGEKYLYDKTFLVDTFIWGGLTKENKCITSNEVINNYCFFQNTYADKLLKKQKLTKSNRDLLECWKKVLNYAKATDEYNSSYKYGLLQIETDLNIKIGSGNFNKKNQEIMVYKYQKLNEAISDLKQKTKDYYLKLIKPKLFKYELLK